MNGREVELADPKKLWRSPDRRNAERSDGAGKTVRALSMRIIFAVFLTQAAKPLANGTNRTENLRMSTRQHRPYVPDKLDMKSRELRASAAAAFEIWLLSDLPGWRS